MHRPPDIATSMIRRLNPVVADAIAAGEVVERPAAVLKELLENSLDAGARHISVEIEGGGLTLICVVDDGGGMTEADLALAFLRHATSKVATIEDLEHVASLGFRGEALASIAAIARVECQSTPESAAHGAQVGVDYGTIGPISSAPPVEGTRVAVRGMFENTPARRAFLRREATEVAAGLRVATALGLAHPDVRIEVRIARRRALLLPGTGELQDTLASVYPGPDGARQLCVSGESVKTTEEGEVSRYSVEGLICEPGAMRRTRDHLFLAVNGRPVQSRSLAFAVEQAYQGLSMPGQFPLGALSLMLPPTDVDVNVHPTKREVRFRDERRVFALVQSVCRKALEGSAAYRGAGLLDAAGSLELRDGETDSRLFAGGGFAATAATAAPIVDARLLPSRALQRGPYRLVGQVRDSYIVAEGPDGLVLVDQHAAHERVIYNRLVAARAAHERRTRNLQPLLVPVVLHLTGAQAEALGQFRDSLAEAGLEIEDFGSGSARLIACDPQVPEQGIDRLAIDILDSLTSEGPRQDLTRQLEKATYTIACHSAIRFGQRLSSEEMQGLLRDLEVADPGITCPHGRPTILEISEARLRREFKRN